jgi:hypothetical protein
LNSFGSAKDANTATEAPEEEHSVDDGMMFAAAFQGLE